MNFKRIILAMLAGSLVLAAASTGTAGPKSATDQLKSSIDQILDVLRDPALKPEDQKETRREKLRRIAGERFDYRRMSQLSLARHWREITDDQKAQFTALFSSLLEDSYMSKIESYTDEKVVYLNERLKKKKSKEYAKIDTKIITETTEIPINYMLYRTGDGPWRVYDMVIEGVSMVNNYRSQFRQILERNSFDSLVKQLKEKKE